MTFKQVIQALEKAGTAQNRKVFRRHGAPENQYGVSFATLGDLRKKIKQDHVLATQLWETGNADARILACMVADPTAFSAKELDTWAKLSSYTMVADQFASSILAHHKLRDRRVKTWTASSHEWLGRIGWKTIASLAAKDDTVPDDYFLPYIPLLEKNIHDAKNRKREAMNWAMIAIGSRSVELSKLVIPVAKRIGKVDIDHGDTGCKTPDAVPYIQKTLARKRKS